MPTPRIYQPGPLMANQRVELSHEAATHVARVLRLRQGAVLTLFDGSGGEYEAELVHVERRHAEVQIGEYRQQERESTLRISLVQGISKGDRMDFAIQKAVELGVQRIVPVETERSVVSLEPNRKEKKQAHWQRVVISACEQCGRNTLPDVDPIQRLDEWLTLPLAGRLGVLLDPEQRMRLTDLEKPTDITVIVGPEGGLTPSEIVHAQEQGYKGVGLGPRILRTETAAIAVLAAIQTCWGDLA